MPKESYFYFPVPDCLTGETLFPLKDYKKDEVELYEMGVQNLLEQYDSLISPNIKIQSLNCEFQEVIPCLPFHPSLLKEKNNHKKQWERYFFCFSGKELKGTRSILWHADKQFQKNYRKDISREFCENVHFSNYLELTEISDNCEGMKFPHLLVWGTLEISGVKIIHWNDL